MLVRTRLAMLAVAAGSVASLANAAAYTIVDDTYGDSYNYYDVPTSTQIGDNTRINYGNSPTIKAVTNDGSGSSYPLAKSLTHAFVKLPDAFWMALGTSNVTSATLTYAASNNSLAGRNIELHPLTQSFVAGAGGDPAIKNSGTANASLAAGQKGADWVTYDGTHAWTSAGGDYDAASFATFVARPVGSTQYLDWDLSTLLNSPTTRAEIQANGLLMKVANETPYSGNIFASLSSSNGSIKPTVTFAIPEPTSLALAGPAGLLAARRRRKMA